MAIDNPSLGGTDGASSPLPQPGGWIKLIDAVALTTDPSSGVSAVIGVEAARRATLWIAADVGAAGAYAQIFPFVSAQRTAPAVGDDVWFSPAVLDTTPTDTLVTGSFASGFDATIAPEWGVTKGRPQVIRTLDGDAGTDKIRMCIPLDVTHARWFHIQAEEVVGAMVLTVYLNISL
jgi:hypothetical protein